MTDKLIINLPFEGFYDSKYSGEVDHIEEREAEYAEERQAEDGIAPELHLEASDFSQVLFDCTDYSACYRAVSKAYVDGFNHVASEYLDLPLALEWESMDSPREYNFSTDRVYAHIPVNVVVALFARSAAEEHKRLRETIKQRFTSRSGFISGYSNSLATWLERDVTEWDHNELGTLLIALLDGFEEAEGERLDWAVYNLVCDGDGLYHEWESAVDWTKYEAAIADKRADLEEELRADDPDYVAPPVRCDRTIDMFSGKEG
jgi:hypothetical protein